MAREIKGSLFRADGVSTGNRNEEQDVKVLIFDEKFVDENPKDAQEALRVYWLEQQKVAKNKMRMSGLQSDSTDETIGRFEEALGIVASNANEMAIARKAILRIRSENSELFTTQIGDTVRLFSGDSRGILSHVYDGPSGSVGRDQKLNFIITTGSYIDSSYNASLFNTIGDHASKPESYDHHTPEQLRILMNETSGGIPTRSLPSGAEVKPSSI